MKSRNILFFRVFVSHVNSWKRDNLVPRRSRSNLDPTVLPRLRTDKGVKKTESLGTRLEKNDVTADQFLRNSKELPKLNHFSEKDGTTYNVARVLWSWS